MSDLIKRRDAIKKTVRLPLEAEMPRCATSFKLCLADVFEILTAQICVPRDDAPDFGEPCRGIYKRLNDAVLANTRGSDDTD